MWARRLSASTGAGGVCGSRHHQRAVILADHGVLPNPLPVPGRRPPRPGRPENVAPPPTLKESERRLILKTLETVGWVIGGTNGAAAALGLHRTTLINRMRKLGITRPARPRPVDGGAVPAEPPEPQH